MRCPRCMRMWIAILLGACGGPPAITPVTADLAPARNPAVVDLQPSHAAITGLAVGTHHTCALHADGTVSCWGANALHQLGVPGVYGRAVPIRVPGIADAAELTADGDLTCVRRAGGAVACWGERDSADDDGKPETIGFAPAIQISGRCVLTTERAVQCMPRNAKAVAAVDGLSRVAQISARYDRGCARRTDGTVACFRSTASWPVPRLARAVDLAVGSQVGCVRMHSGAVRCWSLGYNADEVEVTATTIKDARAIVVSDYEVCAIRRNGRVACSTPDGGHTLPAKSVAELSGVSMLAIGTHACAIARGGLTCFGQDGDGQLGIGWGRGQAVPVRVPGVTDAVAVTASGLANEGRTCIVHRSGRVTCLGQAPAETSTGGITRDLGVSDARTATATAYLGSVDGDGRLWNSYARDKPELVPRLPAVRAVSGECVISTGNELWCFGTMHPTKSDVDAGPIPGAIDVVAVSAPTADHACFVRKSGAALCYQAPDRIVPLDVADARDISLGSSQDDRRYTACVLRADRTVACIDDSDGTFSFAPLRDVDHLRDVRAIATGGGFACALGSTGTVSCWGNNPVGQLGDGTFDSHRTRSAPVVGIDDAIAITAGASHACAVHRDGTVSCWGEALAGQLGTFATSEIDEPQHVAAFDD